MDVLFCQWFPQLQFDLVVGTCNAGHTWRCRMAHPIEDVVNALPALLFESRSILPLAARILGAIAQRRAFSVSDLSDDRTLWCYFD